MDDVVFSTVHGSHLYGLAHAGSDHDSFVVTFSDSGHAFQRTDGVTDVTRVGWRSFLRLAASGSHQSVEAMFSPYKVWTPAGAALRPLIESYRICGGDVFEKYRRTITKFVHGDFKRRCHAARLAINLAQLRRDGTCRPALTPAESAEVRTIAALEGESLLRAILA